MRNPAQILAIDDDPKFLGAIQDCLRSEYGVAVASDGVTAMRAISQARPNLVLLDYCLPEMTGLELLRLFKRRFADLPVIMLTGESGADTIIETMKAGANDYVIKGTEDFEANLRFRIRQLLEKIALIQKTQELQKETQAQAETNRKLSAKVAAQKKSYEILGVSQGTLLLKSEILKLKGTNAFVLITGENGTGKELVARSLNTQEDDPGRPFAVVNCAAVPANLFESEFFGHVKGAFTGALINRVGQFKLADGGDIFLDEIGELPLEMQAKLLRVLQEKTFTPVGGTQSITVDVRVIAATNRDLAEEVRRGRFREDLFYRLNQFEIHVPPLRERPDDILFLAEEFLKRRLPMGRLAEPTKRLLASYPWRGNIRELQNVIERAVVMAHGEPRPLIKPEHLKLSSVDPVPVGAHVVPEHVLPRSKDEISPGHFERCMHWMERLYVDLGLKLLDGSNEALYQKLGVSRAYYFKRKKIIGLSAPAERAEQELG